MAPTYKSGWYDCSARDCRRHTGNIASGMADAYDRDDEVGAEVGADVDLLLSISKKGLILTG